LAQVQEEAQRALAAYSGLLHQHQIALGQLAAARQQAATVRAVPPTEAASPSPIRPLSETHAYVEISTPTKPAPEQQALAPHEPSVQPTEATTMVTSPTPSAPPAREEPVAPKAGLVVRHAISPGSSSPPPTRDVMGRDPLTKIDGINHEFQAKLYAAGINTFVDLCQLSPGTIHNIVAPDPSISIDTESWVRQATRIAYGMY
ncbi:MAG: hypothetical protein ABUL49_00500, partial [bacterium]